MKKLLVWCLVLTMVISTVVFPVSAFATETTEDTTTGDTTTEGTETDTETETTTPPEVVYFNIDFEDSSYSSTTTYFPSSDKATAGTWNDRRSKGVAVDSYDGKAFKFTNNTFSIFKADEDITAGKLLLSMDISMKAGTASSTTWVWVTGTTGSDASYYLTRIGNYGLKNVNGTHTADKLLVSPDGSDILTTVDIIVDIAGKTRQYYVNGEKVTVTKESFSWSNAPRRLKLQLNDNIHLLDNVKMVLNPSSQFSFAQKGEVTSESEYVTVRFSDTVKPSANDFIITNTEGTQVATVTEVKQINGKFYDLKLSEKLEPGTYNLTLNNTALKSVIAGSTSSNTTSAFTVLPEYTFFDMDFENYASLGQSAYLDQHETYGTLSFGGGSQTIVSSNTNQFVGDNTQGIATGGLDGKTIRLNYDSKEPITSGVLKISFDAAFDSAKKNSRSQLYFVNDETTYGNLIFYGTTETGKVIAGVTETLECLNSNPNVPYEDNKAYRWDIVVDLDNNKLTQYCDGSQISSITYTQDILPINKLSVYFTAAISFFDNYKVTLNVDDFGYTASDIDTYSNSTIINFDDTMAFDDLSTAMVFTSSEGNPVTPTSVTKISPRMYKAVFAASDLVEGEYKVTLADSITTSAIGNTPKIESASFTVAKRPDKTFFAKTLDFADVEGGVSLSSTLTNWGVDTENPEEALLVIAVYDGYKLVDCTVGNFEIAAGETEIEKSVTLTTESDLSKYTVRGFAWEGTELYSLCDPVTK